MKSVNNLILGLLLVLSFTSFGQATSEKLRTEQARLEKKISNTKSLLNKTKNNTEESLNELRLIDNQIKFREELVTNFDNQVRGAEVKVIEKDSEIKELQQKLTRLKVQYKELLLYAYKHRNKYGKMMFIFSSTNYNEAIKRGSYLERISDIQNKQFLIIRQHQGLIKEEITSIEKEKQYKQKVLEEKRREKASIEQDKKKQELTYNKFKQEEGKLLSQLREDEYKKELLKQKINAAIKKEIADAEAKRKKAEKAAAAAEEAKRKSAGSSSSSETSSSPTVATKPNTTAEKTVVTFSETKESAALNKSFEGNKGKLPWPVDKGSITEGFGKNAHPTLEGVYTNNSGIDISSPKNAQVRAVFEGEVTSVLNIPGAGKVVIIKHGNYRTVYSNLQETYVKIGSKVTTKQAIGSLLIKENSTVSVAHFEVHQVVGSLVQCLNPTLWVNH
jgi:septal ring factor EnvC (AmiA/AmiB activator)